ncbi:hypothetical protein BDV59DRAFT_205554 [Aspergillus ambiguus]|uniref:uncharacterized protein n=1 Tax=Aspergillus ambiguus TaxID=176160 RepID=UPI003CCD76C3
MLLLRKIFLLLFLILDLSLAELIRVFRDTSAPNYAGSEDSIYLWSAVATFNKEVTNGQLVQIAEDGFKSMLANAYGSVDPGRIPLVMTAMAHQDSNSQWTVYLASSTKGRESLVYQVTKSTRGKRRCGLVWETVPQSLKNALDTCSRDTGAAQHQFDAKCGEMSALLEIAARTGEDPQSIAASSKIVTWQGFYDDEGNYQNGRIKAPCWSGGNFGCKDTLAALASTIEVVRGGRESYANNQPVSVVFQPLFPGFET